LAGAWSANQLTDGWVPGWVLKELHATQTLIDCLVSCAGLWELKDGGVQFANWTRWQRDRASVKAWQAANREKQERFRKRQRGRPKPATISEDAETYPGYEPGYENQRNPVTNQKPVPEPITSGGYGGRDTAVGSCPPSPLPKFCSLHMPDGTDQPCAACGEQRRRSEAQTAKQTLAAKREQQAQARAELSTRLQAIEHCTLCDETGYRGGYPCDHIDRTNTTRNGRAAVNEAMGWT
jgi:hypothetical protein